MHVVIGQVYALSSSRGNTNRGWDQKGRPGAVPDPLPCSRGPKCLKGPGHSTSQYGEIGRHRTNILVPHLKGPHGGKGSKWLQNPCPRRGGDSAGPRTPPPPPPPPRGLQPIVSCQRCRTLVSMGAKGARRTRNTKSARRKILSTLHPNTILKPNLDSNAHRNPQPTPNQV